MALPCAPVVFSITSVPEEPHFCGGQFITTAAVLALSESAVSKKAIGFYTTLLDRYPEFPLTVDVRYRLAREKLRLGQSQEALESIERLIEDHPRLYLSRRARSVLARFANNTDKVTADHLP